MFKRRPHKTEVPQATLSEFELQFLREAGEYLENPSFLMQLANTAGRPLEWTMKKMVPGVVTRASTRALTLALKTAVRTSRGPVAAPLPLEQSRELATRRGRIHQGTAGVAGAVGGFFGAPGLVVELPLTTTIILRSIIDIARQYGENSEDQEVQLECLAVFGHGRMADDDEMESAYLTTRLATTRLVKDASRFLAKQSVHSLTQHLSEGSAPLLVRLIAQIAGRFKIVVSQKVLAQSIPLIGAGAGAAINVAFMDHFNQVAQYHFGMRRLERQYGRDVVQQTYRRLAQR